jgi:hypothetical protein
MMKGNVRGLKGLADVFSVVGRNERLLSRRTVKCDRPVPR